MPSLSEKSERRLATCHPDLQRVIRQAIKLGPDFSVICGFRDETAQNGLCDLGRSKCRWPDSLHNRTPARAVDIVPWPVDWDDWNRFRVLAGYIMGVADVLGVPLRWGGDWDRDYSEDDERFRDLPHFEMLEHVAEDEERR